ncbi:MAG: ABC transporter ATP-binding protein [Candidatus Roizmanbacteria bacterium]
MQTIEYGWKALKISWKANRIYAFFFPLSIVYSNTLFPFIEVFLLAKVLDLLTKFQNLDVSDFFWIIATYLIAYIIRVSLDVYITSKQYLYDIQLGNYIEVEIDKKLTQLDPATFESSSFQDLFAQIQGIDAALTNFLMGIISIIDAAFKIITAILVLMTGFPLFIPIILISVIPQYFVGNKMREAIWPFFGLARAPLIRVSEYIRKLLSSDATSKEVSIFNIGDIMLSKVKHEQKAYMGKFTPTVNSWLNKVMLSGIFQFLAFMLTQYMNLAAVIAGRLSIGLFSLYFQQTRNLALGSVNILENYASASMRNKNLEKYFEFLDTKRIINSPSHPKAIPSKTVPPTIEFKNVSFKYPNSERYILKDFNLTLQSGEKVALVGENGAGKTTIIKLILRFYDVTDGEILINGVNIKELNITEWQRLVGALFQDFIKYQFTFKENVYLGNLKENNNIELLKQAIERSGADKYVEDLPNKYDQVVGKMFEGGIDLSGGQWQKLALARAFFRDAPILILDEPTSAIDAKAEYEIFQKVQQLQKDKTVIIISHRFSTVRNADRILVLNEGKIIEEGNHNSLIKKYGMYAELFNLQAQGYK